MNTESKSIRGTIIKVPEGDQPGLIMADGQQQPFKIEGLWHSAVAPALNQTVELARDDAGQITSVVVVDRQTLAREKMSGLANVSSEQGQQAAMAAKGVYAQLVARMGYPMLVACVLLWIAWFFLPALKVHAGFSEVGFSFSRVAGYSMTGTNPGSSFGLWSFIGLLCIIGPWAMPWLRKSWSKYLAFAPLAFVILTWIRLSWNIHRASSKASEALGQQFAEAMAKRIAEMVSYGYGLWVVLLVSLFIAVWGFVHFRKPTTVAIAAS